MEHTLARSYEYCEKLARREAGNFYHGFKVLPKPERQAMCALYALMRITDDLGDGPGTAAEKRQALTDWRRRFDLSLAGEPSHDLHPAFRHTFEHYRIPREYIEAVFDGVEMDLEPVRYRTFAELYPYCYRVASAVGLACIHIWGFKEEQAKVYAEKAGIAFQLTNILRDLGEDAVRNRIYVPAEDLVSFGYGEDELRRGERNGPFRNLMRFQVGRARQYYDEAEPLAELLEPSGRAVFLVMAGTYRALLDAIEKRDYDVFSSRVSLSAWHKLRLAAKVLPLRWGLK